MTAQAGKPEPDRGGLAVMEDDTVLCADCLDELRAEQACDSIATAVHAWLANLAGQACRCCGATDREVGS
jgi:hypothetical protein